MHLDWWTKSMLTMIAVALSVIAWKLPLIEASHAQHDGCGSSNRNPCYIASGGPFSKSDLVVHIDNASSIAVERPTLRFAARAS
jgi:hypothetical protein